MYDETHYFDSHDPHSISVGGGGGGGGGDGGGGSSSILFCPSQTIQNSSSTQPILLENDHQNIELSNHNLQNHSNESGTVANTTMDFELEQEFNTHLMQEVLVHHHQDPNNLVGTSGTSFDIHQPNWEVHQEMQENQEMNSHHYHHQLQQEQFYQEQQQQQQMELQNNLQCFNSSPFGNHQTYIPPPTPTPDLLNLLHLPISSSSMILPSSSISFSNKNQQMNFHTSSLEIFGSNSTSDHQQVLNENGSSSSILFDHNHHSSLHLNNLPPQPPIFRDLFQNLPQNYGLNGGGGSSSSSLFGGGGGGGGGGGMMMDGDGIIGGGGGGLRQFENSVLDFRREMNINGGSGSGLRRGGGSHGRKHFTTEKQRREQFNEKYDALRSLVPNPTKTDRASVVADAIDYIKELKRTVDELKILVDKKRCSIERNKRLKMEPITGDVESSSMKPTLSTVTDRENSFNGQLRSSWLQRKSKETEVDVRIIDDEVTIKLIQRSKMNNLLLVSKIFDELQLDLLHVSGGCIGDYYSFLFNTKINEGSSVYAGAIAKKLIEGVDKNYAAFKPADHGNY